MAASVQLPSPLRPTLRAAQRVRASADFQRVYAARKSVNTPEVTVAYALNGLPHSRLGVSVGVKHGNAVRRARIKRVFRAAFREARAALPAGFDYVLIPRKGVTEYAMAAIKQALIDAAKRIRSVCSIFFLFQPNKNRRLARRDFDGLAIALEFHRLRRLLAQRRAFRFERVQSFQRQSHRRAAFRIRRAPDGPDFSGHRRR